MTNRNRVILISVGMFLCLGLLAAIGPTLPELARNNDTNLASIGAVYTALFLGAIPSQLLSGWLNDRYGTTPVLVVGLLVFSAGFLGTTLSHWLPLTLLCMGFAGLGDGALVVGSNVLVAQSFARRRASALNMLNVFYGVGAIAGPFLAGIALGTWHTSLPVLWLISALLVLLVFPTLGLNRATPTGIDQQEEANDISARGWRAIFRSPLLWLSAILLFLYVGVEIGTGGWLTTYMQRTTLLPAETSALVTSSFYMALTCGRLLAAGLGTKLHAEYLMLLALIGSVVGAAGVLAGVGNTWFTIVAVLLLGASLGPVYPTLLAVVAARFSADAGKASSVVIASGSAGGMLLPWLQGVLLERFGAESLSQVIAVSALSMLITFGTFLLITRAPKRSMPLAVTGDQ